MRLFAGAYWAPLILLIGVPSEALAACCTTVTPAHVYVPPATHAVIVPHTTYVRPITPQVHAHTPSNTQTFSQSSSPPPAAQAKRTPSRIVQTVLVDIQTASASTRCKRQQATDGCKAQKDDAQTGWSKLRSWLHIGTQ